MPRAQRRPSRTRRACTLLAALACAAGPARAQAPVALSVPACAQVLSAPLTAGSVVLDLQRLADVMSERDSSALPLSHVVRRSNALRDSGCAGRRAPREHRYGPVRLRPLPVVAGTWLNTGYAEDRNNGLVWAGRGLSTSLALGVVARLGSLSAGFVPEVAWQQNREFDIVQRSLPGFSPWIHPHYASIDLPQRFGESSFSTVDPWGQSFARLDALGLSVGWSHESLRIGPALRNPIVMGGSAPGFHHVFVGSDRPIDLGFAHLDVEAMLGRVEESDYYDDRPENDHSRLAVFSFALRPDGLDGLELGFARVLMYPDGHHASWYSDVEPLFELILPASDDRPGNRMSSLFARWIFPRNDAEIYAEWTRNAPIVDLDDLIQEPDHAQGYTLGFQKWSPVGGGGLRLQAELTALQEKGEPRAGRQLVVYYTSEEQIQGHTNRGQMLGAGIGPGADAQFVALDYVRGGGFLGGFLERVRRNDAAAAAIRERRFFPYDHDTEVTGGLRGLLQLGPLSVGGSLSYSRRYSRDFLRDDSNVQLVTEVVWWPGDN